MVGTQTGCVCGVSAEYAEELRVLKEGRDFEKQQTQYCRMVMLSRVTLGRYSLEFAVQPKVTLSCTLKNHTLQK